jgi:malonyl-CoA/methylmalonyl-CoA synthetase
VVESAVVGIPHPDFGEAVTAVVVMGRDALVPSESDLIAQLKSQLAAYKVPKRIHFVDALPRNTMGKVQKNVLRDQLARQ